MSIPLISPRNGSMDSIRSESSELRFPQKVMLINWIRLVLDASQSGSSEELRSLVQLASNIPKNTIQNSNFDEVVKRIEAIAQNQLRGVEQLDSIQKFCKLVLRDLSVSPPPTTPPPVPDRVQTPSEFWS